MSWFPRLFRRKLSAAPLHAARKLPADLSRIIRPEAAMNWMAPMLRSITPQYIEMILRGALSGSQTQQWELFDLMEDTWPRLSKNLNEVKRAVGKLDWKLTSWAEEDTPPSESAEEKAKLVSSMIWGMRPDPDRGDNAFESTIYDILDAWGKGVSVLEIEWAAQDHAISPQSTSWVHPRHYAWSEEGRLGLLNDGHGFNPAVYTGWRPTVEPFPEHKFLVAISKAKSGHPAACALLRPLAWWWCAANFSAEWLLNFGQIFGLPIRWATYDPAQPGLLAKVCDMLENMGSTAWGAFPAGTTFEIKEASKSGGGVDTPQGNILDRADKQCDLLILGQTLTSDVGNSGSRALGEVHADVRSDIILAAADFAAGIINRQLIPAILELNYGETSESPEIKGEPNRIEDAKANAERDQILITAGIQMPKEWFYARHNIPLPAQGEEVIGGMAASSPPDQSGTTTEGAAIQARAANPLPDRTFRAMVADAAGAREKWLKPLSVEIDRLARLVDDETLSDEDLAKFLETAAKQLPDLFADLDGSEFIRRIETALSLAAQSGMADASTQ